MTEGCVPWLVLADVPDIAAEAAEAGGGEVSQSGEAGEGEGICASCYAPSGLFGETTGDEGGLCVVTIAQAVADATAEGNDILVGTGQFDAYYIVVGIDAERGAH